MTNKTPAKKADQAPAPQQHLTAEDCERLGLDPTPYGYEKK